jgi:hypothetical protein
VSEDGREDTLRVVESLLAPDEEKRAALAAFQNYGKLVETPELHDVVWVVEGGRFPAHRVVLAAQSEYFRRLLLSGMLEGSGVPGDRAGGGERAGVPGGAAPAPPPDQVAGPLQGP